MSAGERERSLVVGVDIGGTFTDVVLYAPDAGRLSTARVSFTLSDPAGGFLAGLDRALDEAGASCAAATSRRTPWWRAVAAGSGC